MKIHVFMAALFLMPSMAMAALQPTDFAYGMPLSLEDNGAVYRLSVPVEVYQTVTRGDLGDIRIFNKSKAEVPHVLRWPKIDKKVHEQRKSLPFFPLYANHNETAKESLSVRVEKREDGTILNIHSNGTKMGRDRKLIGYIIDATAHEQRIDALDISWQFFEESFVTTVSLEQSADLTSWSTLVRDATLARMNFKGHQIKKERVALPSKTVAYIRLLWPEGQAALDVKDIVAIQRYEDQARPHRWTALKGRPADASGEADKQITAYEYDGGAQLPVDRVRLRFVEKNTILEAALYSRPDREFSWYYRDRAIFYDLGFDGATLLQDTVLIGQTSDRYWRLEIAKNALGDVQNTPTVELGWLPHDLLFTARGQGPFMLAYGSARLDENTSPNDNPDLLSQVIGSKAQNLLKEATVLPKTVLGGPAMLTPVPPPLPWRKWLLWGVLVVGVGLIARMALSLGKGMNKAKE